jgi:hypothetical protein
MTDPLVLFLYILGRDHLPLGAVEGIMEGHVEPIMQDRLDTTFSSPQLEAWAIDVARRIQS